VVTNAEILAELRGITYTELDAAVERNSARVFAW
jgi:Tat protein secretion system quality control protein TatD with DNase activity